MKSQQIILSKLLFVYKYEIWTMKSYQLEKQDETTSTTIIVIVIDASNRVVALRQRLATRFCNLLMLLIIKTTTTATIVAVIIWNIINLLVIWIFLIIYICSSSCFFSLLVLLLLLLAVVVLRTFHHSVTYTHTQTHKSVSVCLVDYYCCCCNAFILLACLLVFLLFSFTFASRIRFGETEAATLEHYNAKATTQASKRTEQTWTHTLSAHMQAQRRNSMQVRHDLHSCLSEEEETSEKHNKTIQNKTISKLQQKKQFQIVEQSSVSNSCRMHIHTPSI